MSLSKKDLARMEKMLAELKAKRTEISGPQVALMDMMIKSCEEDLRELKAIVAQEAEDAYH